MKSVACLTGSGTAPELMAEAMHALDAVARVHGFAFEQVHAPFGGVALARTGQTVPASTRDAVLGSDAVLVAGAEEPALDEVMAELDLRARATRVRFGQRDDVVFVTSVREDGAEWTVRRAFAIAETRSMRLTCVGDTSWCDAVHAAAAEHEHVRVEHVSPKDAMPFAAFNAGRFDVVVVAPQWAEGMVEIAAAAATHRVAAHALLAEHGPSLFVPSPDGGFALAGHGVVNPSSMLLATALTLEHGLGQRAAGETLAGAVSAALVDEPVRFGARSSTREFTSRVLGGLQVANRNAEFYSEAV
jgi:isocitrate/isopropylmalate dehydrogenase